MAEIDVVLSAERDPDVDMLGAAVPEPPSLPPALAALDERLGGRLARLVDDGELTGRSNTAVVLHVNGELPARRVAVGGLGPSDSVDADAVRTAAAAVARRAREIGGTVGWILDDSLLALPEQAPAVVEGVMLGAYDPGRWKTGQERRPIERLVLVGADSEASEAARRAATVSRWTNRARDLANMPPNELTPERLAERAREIAGGNEHATVSVLDVEEARAHGMGAFAAVAQGSHNPGQMILMRYEPPEPARQDLVLGLVGKAITFDTGGISLKPGTYMEEMKGDMSGGAAVVEATGAIAELGLPVRVVSVVAATENMPGGGAYRPGDILTALNGKTIEVINTDAEGRLVLADALVYAREQGATHLVDLATLTGAMQLALGDLYAGVYANEPEWREAVVEAGEASGDHAWPFPLHPRYRRYVDSVFADMKNATLIREASPTLAAAFLQEFAGDGPWAHVDIAGPAFFTYDRGDYLSQKGGTGYGVRLLVELATRLAA